MLHLPSRFAAAAGLAVLGLAVSACSDSGPDAAQSAAQSDTVRSASYGGSGCAGDPAWITAPSFPTEVSPDTICGFDQFAWQALLDLVQPSAAGSEILNFETWMPYYGIFVPAGQAPIPYGQQPPDPCNPPEAVAGKAAGSAPVVYTSLIKQAGVDQPLIAPDGELVWYAMSVNEAAYDMLTACDLYRSDCAGALKPGNQGTVDVIGAYPNLAFPAGAVEIKTSWKVLSSEEASSNLFYVTPGWLQDPETSACRQVTLGLVGFHLVAKTPTTPAMIWATFEHRNNVPDCSALDASPPLGGDWSFFDLATCDNCTTNVYEPGKPAQICRMHPWGDSTIGTFPVGQNCEEDPQQYICQEETKTMLAESTAALRQLNPSVQELIRKAAEDNAIDPVWANYELVGNVWTRDGVTPPQLQAQVGSLSAANTTMESFVQNGGSARTNPNSCFSCHNQDSGQFGRNLPPVGLSHLFDRLADDSGGCAAGSLPAACEPYFSN